MSKVSLKWRIYLIGIVPFIFFLISALISVWGNYSIYKETKKLQKVVKVIEASSSVVHETQKERGKSVGFLSGGVTYEVLKKQRDLNDKKLIVLKELFKEQVFENSYQKEILNELQKYESLRKNVSSKNITSGKLIQEYSNIIRRLLDIEIYVSKKTIFPDVSARMRSIRILEDAKESGGKFRAGVTGLLGRDKPFDDNKFSQIISLKAGVDEGISSSGVIHDEKTDLYIKKIKESNEWKEVGKIFQVVLKKSEQGNYGFVASDFFFTVTGALDIVLELIMHQKKGLKTSVKALQDKSMSSMIKMLTLVTVLICILFFFVSLSTRSITNSLKKVIDLLRESSKEVSNSSGEIAGKSSELSEASNRQASSLQETVSAIDEISSMVQRNAESAELSTTISKKSRDEVTIGKRNVEEMIQSISDISDSNQEIINEIQNNNEQISKITAVISEIGEKTKVINDIVFQTKLLSFNASVEAARAGEHGKGFTIVAEEVGTLASMSGQSAIEISEMLESSMAKTNEIINASKSKIEGLMTHSKKKVTHGTDIAKRCGEILESIYTNVGSVDDMVKEISGASEEQALGVREITSAMQELDDVTHENSNAASSSSSMAKELRSSANNLDVLVQELTILMDGKNK